MSTVNMDSANPVWEAVVLVVHVVMAAAHCRLRVMLAVVAVLAEVMYIVDGGAPAMWGDT